ncbi:unnamed protein product [Caenorhabditis nigoni]
MDFDYDRSKDRVPKTIMDMPVRLMYKITENLDPVERAYLRTMNKPIKDVIDARAPVFNEISINVTGNSLSCYRQCQKCHEQKGLEYLIPLFQIPKLQVNHLSLSLLDPIQELEDFLSIPFRAKSVEILVMNIEQTSLFLSALNPGELESISLKPIRAKHVQLRIWLNEDDILKFSHLKSFKFGLFSHEPIDFQNVREIISNFKQFESCELKHFHLLDDFPNRSICEAFGEEIPFGPLKTVKHRYQIPESNEYLEFEIEDEGSLCEIKINKIR